MAHRGGLVACFSYLRIFGTSLGRAYGVTGHHGGDLPAGWGVRSLRLAKVQSLRVGITAMRMGYDGGVSRTM